MSNGPGFRVRVTSTRSGTTISYSSTGVYRSLSVNDVRNADLQTNTLTGTGSKAFWEAVLNAIVADIEAGHGGGS